VFEKDENRTVHVAPCGSSQVVTTDDAATFE